MGAYDRKGDPDLSIDGWVELLVQNWDSLTLQMSLMQACEWRGDGFTHFKLWTKLWEKAPASAKPYIWERLKETEERNRGLVRGIRCWHMLSGSYAEFNRTFVDVARLQLRLSELMDTIGTGDYDVLVLTVLLLEDPEHPILADN